MHVFLRSPCLCAHSGFLRCAVTKSLSIDLADRGIAACLLHPGSWQVLLLRM